MARPANVYNVGHYEVYAGEGLRRNMPATALYRERVSAR